MIRNARRLPYISGRDQQPEMSENVTESIKELKLSLEMEQIRRVEAELRLHDQELAMQQKDDLLASMSHELRTL